MPPRPPPRDDEHRPGPVALLPGFDVPSDAGVRSSSTTLTTGKPMMQPFHLAPGNYADSPDGNDDQPFASVTDANVVPVPKTQPGEDHAAIHWFQHQQEQFAARFLGPSFREG